jgi:hypothetical protein
MTFLQPILLLALPFIAMPIVIHLMNQSRYRTVHWAATMFLLQARRMARGMAKLRYWLVLAARTLAVAGLIFAVSRPMAGGWVGWTTGAIPDQTIIVLDQSASMEFRSATGSAVSRREASLRKLSELLSDLGGQSELILFDGATNRHRQLTRPEDLLEIPDVSATSTTTDMPSLLRSVADFVSAQEPGRTDIWVCSDLQTGDWNPDSGLWQTIRSRFRGLSGLRFCFLTWTYDAGAPPGPLSEAATQNFAVTAQGVHRRETEHGAELVMDLRILKTRSSVNSSEGIPPDNQDEPVVRLPVSFVINGARTVTELDVSGNQLIRNGHTVPLDQELKQGAGTVELPADLCPSDNRWNFVFEETAHQKVLIVAENPEVRDILRIAATASVDGRTQCESVSVTADEMTEENLAGGSLVLWQGALPRETQSVLLHKFVAAGGSLFFFPSESSSDAASSNANSFGLRWSEWKQADNDNSFWSAIRWKADDDVLASSRSGTPLPVDQLRIQKYSRIEAQAVTPLLQIDDNRTLIGRMHSNQGGVWFCSTLPLATHSNMTDNGVILYVMIQRALARGAASTGGTRTTECRYTEELQSEPWQPLDEHSRLIPASRRSLLDGLYRSDRHLIALNRPTSEDLHETVSREKLSQLMDGLDWKKIDGQSTGESALVSEVWRMFLVLMIAALLLEAVLCLPEPSRSSKTVGLS